MLDFEWDPTNVPTVKLGLHIAQILLSFVVWCLEIGVFARSKVTGDNGWTFAVVRQVHPFPTTPLRPPAVWLCLAAC